MAAVAGVPVVPMVTWGGQRILTKGRPRDLTRGRTIALTVGEAFRPPADEDPAVATAELHRRMGVLLDETIRAFPDQPRDEADRWWVPRAYGGTAPTLEEAAALDAAERAARDRRR